MSEHNVNVAGEKSNSGGWKYAGDFVGLETGVRGGIRTRKANVQVAGEHRK